MRSRIAPILINSLLSVAISFLVCTTPLLKYQLIILLILAIVANILAFRAVTVNPLIPFAKLSWLLSLLAYMVLVIDFFLGGFGRLAPLEIIFAPISAVTGILCLVYSFRIGHKIT